MYSLNMSHLFRLAFRFTTHFTIWQELINIIPYQKCCRGSRYKKLSEITSMQFNYILYLSLAPYIVVLSTVETRKMRCLFGWRAINYEGAHCKVYYIWKLSSNLTCFIQKGDNLLSAASNFK